MPNDFELFKISFEKFDQNSGFKFILINPGLTTSAFSIILSLSTSDFEIIFPRSIGDFWLAFDNTIATLVDISQSNFAGGISALIPSNFSGNIISSFLDKTSKTFLILSKYISKIFI